jgi:hypothetical protein
MQLERLAKTVEMQSKRLAQTAEMQLEQLAQRTQYRPPAPALSALLPPAQ